MRHSISILICLGFCHAATALQISELQCEYSVNPIGIATLEPRLSWTLQSDKRADDQA